MEVQAVLASSPTSHVLIVPYPSRGHINPMMNLSKLLVSKNPNILVTLVLSEEWFASFNSEPKPSNVTLRSIPNFGPHIARSADDLLGVVEAVMTKMEAPLERLLDRLQLPPTVIIYDAFLFWAVGVGIRRNIPVAAFWTTSTSELWVQFFHLFQQNQHCRQRLSENGGKLIDYIPGISWVRLTDIPLLENRQILQWAMKSCEWILKAQYLLLPSIYELEPQVIDALKSKLSIPIYTIGPNIPYFNHKPNSLNLSVTNCASQNYLNWLDNQPNGSVLYISYGSFLSVSSEQMEEIAYALKNSRVRFLWVTRGESYKLKEIYGEMGLIVPWCDQLRVLLHNAIGGYWTHCGWNSVIEGVFSGVPFLTFPIVMDQPLISKIIVEDWKVGWRVKKDDKLDSLVRRDEIAFLLRKFMDLDSDAARDLRKRAKELQRICQVAISKNGSSETNIREFLKNIMQSVVTQRGQSDQVQVPIENFN